MRAAILLAAGASRRFGCRDKLQERLAGRRLLDHAVAHVRASGVCRILLVSARPVRTRGATPVRVPDFRSGLSASLRAGLAALRPIEREVLIFLADMPFAYAPRLRLRPGVEAIRPRFRDRPGHPMLVRTHVARMRLGQGDKGLGGALATVFVPGQAGHVLDIDTVGALRLARRHGSRAVGRRSQLA
jgi:molybdenum cofactor cytidylyltransferase